MRVTLRVMKMRVRVIRRMRVRVRMRVKRIHIGFTIAFTEDLNRIHIGSP